MEKYCYEYPRPAVTADCIVFGFDGKILNILLIERKYDPYLGCWALPGGFIEMDEETGESARRELKEETGLDGIFFKQLHTFSRPGRDPRHRTVSVAYYTIVKTGAYQPVSGDDAARVAWFPLSEMPDLAFDHQEIVQIAVDRLKDDIRYHKIETELSLAFTLNEIQALYEFTIPDMRMPEGEVLLVIDAQNDFCRPDGSLYVPGAGNDMERLCRFIRAKGSRINGIILSQDAHQIIDISHPAFWAGKDNKHPAPFTSITHQDVIDGTWIPLYEKDRATAYLQQLEQQGEFPHLIWPEHCIAGSVGAAIVPELMASVMEWSRAGRFFTVLQKGENPLTEHFGIIRANIPDCRDARTQENRDLIARLSEYETIWIAGEAKSHCVANTVRQLLAYPGLMSRIVLLEDCMSDVAGFKDFAAPIYKEARKAGARFVTHDKA